MDSSYHGYIPWVFSNSLTIRGVDGISVYVGYKAPLRASANGSKYNTFIDYDQVMRKTYGKEN